MYDQLKVRIFENAEEMGEAAAEQVSQTIGDSIARSGKARVVFASAPSQITFLQALKKKPIQWEKVIAFIQDEYVGASLEDKHSFGKFAKDMLFSQVSVGQANYLNGVAVNLEEEFDRYAALIKAEPIDVICLGIGENGHLAFNEPHEANFDDPRFIKRITLDEKCRNQQFHDFGFKSIEDVPEYGMTLTIPAIMSCDQLVCIVPGERKAEAIRNTLKGEIVEKYPASIMRKHSDATLYLDKASAQLL